MSARTIIDGVFAEGGSAVLTATVQDNASPPAAIPGGSLTTLTWTLYDERSDTIINSRDAVDAKASVDAQGLLTLALDAADMVIVKDRALEERHVVLVEWTWNGGDESGAHEIVFTIRNMGQKT